MGRVRSGLEVLLDDVSRWRGRRIGLVCNHTAVDGHLVHAIDRLTQAGVVLARLFGPEHGVRATAQDMEGVDEVRDPVSGAPVVSLYGHDAASLHPRPEWIADLDAVFFDVQDVGARYYTFQATLGFVMQVAGPLGVPVVVLDRPNPIGGQAVEGNVVRPGFESFVGAFPIAVRHGMTVGELALFFVQHLGLRCDVEVVPCEGWSRDQWFEDTGLPWVYPSPNMPTVDTATVYPGTCLIEATTLSEGRGTTRPFHLVGAPGMDPDRAVRACQQEAMRAGLAGVGFRPAAFQPGFQKHRGLLCTGVEVHVTDRRALDALLLGLVVTRALHDADPARFGWRGEPYEFVADPPAIDLLTGSAEFRGLVEGGGDLRDLVASWEPDKRGFLERRAELLIYP